MTAEKGSMSSIFTDNTESRMLIVLVNDIYEDYLPITIQTLKKLSQQLFAITKKLKPSSRNLAKPMTWQDMQALPKPAFSIEA